MVAPLFVLQYLLHAHADFLKQYLQVVSMQFRPCLHCVARDVWQEGSAIMVGGRRKNIATCELQKLPMIHQYYSQKLNL